MIEMLSYSFMQRAIIAGIVISVVCPAIGLFLVLRRLSLIGDSLAHVTLAGVAFGILFGIYPIYSAIVFALFASLCIEFLRKKYENYAEISLAIVLSGGIAVATVLISLGNTAGILSYLFGSIVLVTEHDIIITAILGIFVLVSILILYKPLFYISFDEESARVIGVPVKQVNVYFSILVAITIAISMRVVGILLVTSLMTLPVAASLQIARSFKSALIYSIGFSVVSVITGLVSSFYLNLAPGGTIVLAALTILLLVMFFSSK